MQTTAIRRTASPMSQTSRREFLKATVATGAALVVQRSVSRRIVRGESGDSTETGPNVVFVFSDTHRWHSMSVSEMPHMITPNIERLSSQGLSMRQTISNFPLCSPYRAMLMTGRWPYHQQMRDGNPGMIDNGMLLSPDQETLAREFQNAGYTTGYFGKWHLGGTNGIPFGFDQSIIWPSSDDHWNSTFVIAPDGEPIRYTGYNAIGMTDQALEFIDENQSVPFFLMLSINPPHQIFADAPQAWQDEYASGERLSLRHNVNLTSSQDDFWEDYCGYHAHISAIDHELGRIMQRLDDLNLSENTILIYTSDHGSMFMSHGRWNKRKPWEESIRVPFIIRWPELIAAGSTSDALFGTIDHMPTILGLAGLPIPASCDGHDFSPLFLGQHMQPPDSQFIMGMPWRNSSWRGVRSAQHTLAIMHSQNDDPDLLFDNLNDPFQMVNRYGDSGLSDVQSTLTNQLLDFLALANDPFSSEVVGSRIEPSLSHRVHFPIVSSSQ